MEHTMIRIGGFIPFFAVSLGLVLAGPVTAPAQKQERQDPGGSFTRTNPKFIAAFREVVAPVARSTVRVLCDGKETALGMVVDRDGWILTKAHDLTGAVACRLRDGKVHEAQVIGVHQRHDLALLKIAAGGLTPAKLADSKSVPVGNWVAAVGTGEDPVAIGVVSVATRDVPKNGGPMMLPGPGNGFLGIALEQDTLGIKVASVQPKTPAAEVGLKSNDI